MAKNGSKSVAATSWDTLKFTWSQVSQSITGNSSTIDWVLSLVSGSSGRIDSTALKEWKVTIDGREYSGSNTIGISNNSTLVLAAGTTTIEHDTDGSKTFDYSFSQEFDITFGGQHIGTISGSGSGELDTILRASEPKLNVSSADMGTSVKISTPRSSEEYTHDLAYKFADLEWQAIATDVQTSVNWEIPMKLANSIPNKLSGTVTIRCITKQGTKLIGSKTVQLTAKVPASVVPVVDGLNIVDVTEGVAAQFGALVQHKSALGVEVQASGAYGSTITARNTVFEGKVYYGPEWTSDVIKGSGLIDLVTTVTDSRGRTAKKTTTITVVTYNTPKIFSFEAIRCDASGNPQSDGLYVQVNYKYAVASVGNKNTVNAAVKWKVSGDTEYQSSAIHTDTALESETSVTVSSLTFAADETYDLLLTVTDWFGASATYGDFLPSDEVIMDILADGSGISFLEFCKGSGVTIRGGIPRTPITVPAGTNLDTLLEPGFYIVPDENASLIVLAEGDGTQRRQIYRVHSKTDHKIKERSYDGTWGAWYLVYAGAGNVLWSGTNVMSSGSISLSEAISKQPNGIVLVFSHYNASYYFNSFFVPKYLVHAHSGSSQQFLMSNDGKFSTVGSKYLLISDTTIEGHANNGASGTGSGITYDNSRFALRYVIGV